VVVNGTTRKSVGEFLKAVHGSVSSISIYAFQRYCRFCSPACYFFPSPKFHHVPLGVGGSPFSYKERKVLLIVRAISFQDSQPHVITIHQCHRRTDDMRSQGLTENAGHENDGLSKLQDMTLEDMKLSDQCAGHEIAGHEIDGPNFAAFARHEIAGHEIAGQNSVRPTLHYYEVCIVVCCCYFLRHKH